MPLSVGVTSLALSVSPEVTDTGSVCRDQASCSFFSAFTPPFTSSSSALAHSALAPSPSDLGTLSLQASLYFIAEVACQQGNPWIPRSLPCPFSHSSTPWHFSYLIPADMMRVPGREVRADCVWTGRWKLDYPKGQKFPTYLQNSLFSFFFYLLPLPEASPLLSYWAPEKPEDCGTCSVT